MSDFNPVTLYFILAESLGVWLWILLALALVLLAGIVAALAGLRRARAGAGPALMAGIAVAVLVAAALTYAVPLWTLAGPEALNGPLDIGFAFLFALVPGAVLGALAFILAARRRAGRAAGLRL